MTALLDRTLYSVMVPDAQALGMIAVIRSLGRAGYRVCAISSQENALGLRSHYSGMSAVHPEYGSPEFLPWLDTFIEDNSINAIVPSEGFLHACVNCYEDIKRLIPDAVDCQVWQRCMSKIDTHRTLNQTVDAAENQPLTSIVRNKDDIPLLPTIANDSGPFYVKADARFAKFPVKGSRVVRCASAEILRQTLAEILREYEAVIYQHYAPGTKVGVSLWRHNNEIYAENMTLAINTYPWQGGMMSLRKTFWHRRLLEDAKRKMEALDWQGVAMMEYTWNPKDDRFYFIEINARFWGYLHLDLYAGKDFPVLQLDAFFGRDQTLLGPPERNVTCRYAVPGETGHLLSRLSSRELSVVAKLGSIAAFIARFADPFTRSDLLFPGDRALYWIEAFRFVKAIFKSRLEWFGRDHQ